MNAHESENYLVNFTLIQCIKKVGRLFLGPNLVSFNRTLVPCEISKLTSEKKILVSMSEEI